VGFFERKSRCSFVSLIRKERLKDDMGSVEEKGASQEGALYLIQFKQEMNPGGRRSSYVSDSKGVGKVRHSRKRKRGMGGGRLKIVHLRERKKG